MMAKLKFADCLIQQPGKFPAELLGKSGRATKEIIPGVKATHVLTADESAQKGFFFVDGTWLWEGAAKEPVGVPHKHDFDHVLCFAGGHIDDPQDFQAEITVWLDGRKEVIKRNSIIFVPAGVVHGPILFSKIPRPVYFLTVAITGKYTRTVVDQVAKPTAKKKYAIVDALYKDFSVAGNKDKDAPPPPPPNPNLKGARIMHIEEDAVPGAFYVDFVWIFKGTGAAPAKQHDHDWPELIAFAGSDPANPYNIGGEMSVMLEDEYHATDKSTLICIPAHTQHCPWEFHDIKKPTLVFTAGPSHTYTGSHKKEDGTKVPIKGPAPRKSAPKKGAAKKAPAKKK
jgi:hypothetical protein